MISFFVALNLLCAIVGVLGGPESLQVVGLPVDPTAELISQLSAEVDSEAVIVSDPGDGISHVKVSRASSSTSSQAIAVLDPLEGISAAEDALRTHLDRISPGTRLDMTTPKDGHCLFWALKRGGLLRSTPTPLDIAELRGALLAMASQDQLDLAKDETETVGEYVSRMSKRGWGDNLMIVLAAVAFDKPISVISATHARTCWPNGDETPGVHHTAIWVAHRGELHYYGVIRPGYCASAQHVSNPRGASHEVRQKQDKACAGRGKRRLVRFSFGKKSVALHKSYSYRKGKRRQHGGQVDEDEPEHQPAEDEPQANESGIPD